MKRLLKAFRSFRLFKKLTTPIDGSKVTPVDRKPLRTVRGPADRSVWRLAVAAVIGALLPLTASSLDLGELRLAHAPAKNLSVAFSTSARAFTGFALRVGGVAFTAEANGKDGLVVAALTYDAKAHDGKRLKVRLTDVNGGVHTVTAGIFDWQLVPLARFVADGNEAAVTLFGELLDEDKTRELRRKGFMIANYHPALSDTLLGLRLLQSDMVAFEPNAADLFKDQGAYILGAGEVAPSLRDVEQNRDRFNRVQAWLAKQPQHHQSYVVGDIGQKVTFSFVGDRLTLAGDPVWSCWRKDKQRENQIIEQLFRENASPDAYVVAALNNLEEELQDLRMEALRKLSQGPTPVTGADAGAMRADIELGVKAAYARVFRAIGTQYGRSKQTPSLISAATVERALERNSPSEYSNIIKEAYQKADALPEQQRAVLVSEMQSLFGKAQAKIEKMSVVKMDQYSREFSRLMRAEAGVNPHVYAVLKATVGYAALFRHAKRHDPNMYATFVDSLKDVPVAVAQPKAYHLTTPTLYPKSVSAESAQN